MQKFKPLIQSFQQLTSLWHLRYSFCFSRDNVKLTFSTPFLVFSLSLFFHFLFKVPLWDIFFLQDNGLLHLAVPFDYISKWNIVGWKLLSGPPRIRWLQPIQGTLARTESAEAPICLPGGNAAAKQNTKTKTPTNKSFHVSQLSNRNISIAHRTLCSYLQCPRNTKFKRSL